jgi:nucleotide-binding universal stress UspA family protein
MTSTARLGGPVVVAVDGTDDSLRAVRYAATEATRRGVVLRLVHVLHETVPWTPAISAFTYETLRGIGGRILEEAAHVADEETDGAGGVQVVLAQGPRIPALLEHADDASLVVVGTRSSRVKRILTGSTSVGLAARARCPVVCIPATWQPDLALGRVVAGVDGSEATGPVLDAAFGEAKDRGLPLAVLHAWRPSQVYDVAARAALDERWRQVATAELEAILEPRRAAFPEVDVSIELPHDWPADALTAAGEKADLLLLGRRGHGGPLGLSIGGTSRALLSAGPCPVQIVPVPDKEVRP